MGYLDILKLMTNSITRCIALILIWGGLTDAVAQSRTQHVGRRTGDTYHKRSSHSRTVSR